ncbi:MAG: hypothetical protein MRY83_01920 [Flavobacteriales bacterium]|nr:hypothetical protein [Flavobacteriales bacterium]
MTIKRRTEKNRARLRTEAYKNEWVEALEAFQPNYFITIAFNPDHRLRPNTPHQNLQCKPEVIESYYRSILKKVMGRTDRNLIGKSFQKTTNKHKRCTGFAFLEHVSSNAHYHILLKNHYFELDHILDEIKTALRRIKLNGATIDGQEIYDLRKVCEYCLKETLSEESFKPNECIRIESMEDFFTTR